MNSRPRLPSIKQPSASNAASAGTLPGSGASLYGASVEYGLHCLLWLTAPDVEHASSRDLAELQGVPPAMVAKIMSRLQKAGIVQAKPGIAGGYTLVRSAGAISVLDVVDAIEVNRRLFHCKEVRRGCALFGKTAPDWATGRICEIHAVMLRAEKRMRAELANTSLASLARSVRQPPEFVALTASWIKSRGRARNTARIAAVKQSRGKPRAT
jgi:Rrf2 family protein